MFRLTKNPSQEPDVFRSTDSPASHNVLDRYFEDSKKSLGAILSSLPGTGLKRKLSSDMRDIQSLDVPSKIPKKGLCCGLGVFFCSCSKTAFFPPPFLGANETLPVWISSLVNIFVLSAALLRYSCLTETCGV